MRLAALAIVLGFVPACDSKPTPKAEPGPAKEPASASAPAKPEPAAKPMAPAPEGTVAIDRVYVHTCATEGSCPTLLQDAGAAHCTSLPLGGMKWRLPTLVELESWVGNAELRGYDVFHWSGSPWDEDPAMLWIFDPASKSKTTAKPDRKPFTIRCVAQPSSP